MSTPKGFSTRHELRSGSRYPAVSILWRPDDSWASGGYLGELTVWLSGHDKDPHAHTVGIGQGAPLGHVTVAFDQLTYGAWESTHFDGVGVTERDLQWATLWAVLALKNRRAVGDLPALPKL
jgi:hypothetical protein